MKEQVIAMCACADILNFKYRGLKMFLLKLKSELQNLIKRFLRSGMQTPRWFFQKCIL